VRVYRCLAVLEETFSQRDRPQCAPLLCFFLVGILPSRPKLSSIFVANVASARIDYLLACAFLYEIISVHICSQRSIMFCITYAPLVIDSYYQLCCAGYLQNVLWLWRKRRHRPVLPRVGKLHQMHGKRIADSSNHKQSTPAQLLPIAVFNFIFSFVVRFTDHGRGPNGVQRCSLRLLRVPPPPGRGNFTSRSTKPACLLFE